jgi:hypothetical protein
MVRLLVKKEPGGNRSAWGERLPSISAGFLPGGGAAVSLGGRSLAATGTTYPVSGRFVIPSSRVRVHGGGDVTHDSANPLKT